jgi:Icc-related predicted phosphoesterase
MKVFVEHTRHTAEQLEHALASLDADARVALVHYAPVPDTLEGERLEIYPFLGSYLLGEAIDRAGADLAVHGHAHAGKEKGSTEGGIPVRNVAMPVIGDAYRVYCLGGAGECGDTDTAVAAR